MVFHISLDSSVIDPGVFALTRVLGVAGTIDSIEPDLFKKLHNLCIIWLSLQNIRSFFHSSTNRWMEHLLSQGVTYGSKSEMESDLSAQ